MGTYNYAGCLGVPRMLRLQGERFIQVTQHGCWCSCLHAEAAGIRVDLLSILLARSLCWSSPAGDWWCNHHELGPAIKKPARAQTLIKTWWIFSCPQNGSTGQLRPAGPRPHG